MKAFKIPNEADESMDEFATKARVAGCGGGCGGACGCGSFPPGKGRGSSVPVPMIVNSNDKKRAGVWDPAGGDEGECGACNGPEGYKPYDDPEIDARFMTRVAGTATIAAGASATVNIEPTQGCFKGYYVQILAVDNAAPNTRGRVEVGRWFVGDCPGDCRTIPVFSDVFEGLANGCCTGVPMRTNFGRTNNGDQLSITITNPAGGFANARVQVIVTGFCNRGTCGC